MKKVLCGILASLLSLTLNLIPPNEVHAQPQQIPSFNAYDLIAEVNALRASNGLPAYNVNSILMQIAQTHSEYQASIKTWTHYGADGSRPFQRALAAGYPVAGDLSAGGFFSENVMNGRNLSPAETVSAWMGDAPHQYTMLSPNLQDVGAGVVTSDGVTYYTLDAGSSTGSTVNYTPPAGGAGVTPATVQVANPVVASTPDEKGTVSHEVKAGQTLWSIATAYGTTVDEIKKLNKLTSNDIYIGQKLIVRQAAPQTQTATSVVPTFTVTIGVLLSTATDSSITGLTSTNTPVPEPPASLQQGGMMAGIIILVAILAAGLGTWLGRKKKDE